MKRLEGYGASFALLLCTSAGIAAPVGTAFTYQGSLVDGVAPANGQYDFQFTLFFDPINNAPASGAITIDNLQVTNGLFTAQIDPGVGIIEGDALWLQIGVRPGASGGAYSILTPRQPLSPVPYAIGLSLPYSAFFSSGSALISLTQNGNGPGVFVQTAGAGTAIQGAISNATNTNPALAGSTNGSGNAVVGFNSGTGAAGHFEITKATDSANALEGKTNGSGAAVSGLTTGTGSAIYGQTGGGGNAVFGYNLGTAGNAGYFRSESVGNSNPTLRVEASGGDAGNFQIVSSGNPNSAINASTMGTGRAGTFTNTNANSGITTLLATTNGGANAIAGVTTGAGRAGFFQVNNASNGNPALEATTNGTGLAGKFGGDVNVDGVIYRQYNNTQRRATPIAYGRIGSNDQGNTTVIGSANITVSFDANTHAYTVTIIGESNPETWTVQANLAYSEPVNPDYTIAMRVGLPNASGKFKIYYECDSGCGTFTSQQVEVHFSVYRP